MADEQQPPLKVLAFNCTLKRSKEQSSTDVLLKQMMDALEEHGAIGAVVRAVDHNIKPGVSSDDGEGDDWPALRQRVINCDILVMGTPIWLGQPSSVAKRVMERMDAFLGETDDKGRMPSYGKVGIVVVVGNEDGAHHCAARRSPRWDSRRHPAVPPIGSARRSGTKFTRISRPLRRSSRTRPKCSRPMPHTLHVS
jgi:multimeric flavodoxin WrbA